MNLKDAFLQSLSDEQLGFFHAHEYNANLEDLIQDHINPIQFGLFIEWWKSQSQSIDHSEFTDILSKLDNLTSMVSTLSLRMDSLEARVTSTENAVQKLHSLEENRIIRMAKLEEMTESNRKETTETPKSAMNRCSVNGNGAEYNPRTQNKPFNPAAVGGVATPFANIKISQQQIYGQSRPSAKPQPAPKPPRYPVVIARNEYDAQDTDELSFKVGDRIELMHKHDSGWWQGKIGTQIGLFPANYIQE